MNLASALAAAGVWPAVPLTGYLIFARPQRLWEIDSLPLPTAAAVVTVAGLAVWSVPLLGAAIAGVYQPAYFGATAWGIVLLELAALLRTSSTQRLVESANTRVARTAETAGQAAPSASRSKRRGRRAATVRLPHPAGGARTDRVSDTMLVVALLIAATLYLGFPTESIYGGRDEGVYANHAIYLANHGRLDVPYPWAAEDSDVLSSWMGFPGFYATPGTMTVQFGHLLPVWLAQAYATLGADGLFRLNGVFALLSLAVFYGVARMAVPSPFALTATLFLAFNPSQLWIARVTLSEILAQLFIWSGLLLLLQALRDGRAGCAGWAGVFMGLGAFVRLDGLAMLPLLFLSHVVWKLFHTADPGVEGSAANTGASVWRALYQTALPVSALALAGYVVASTPYFYDVAHFYLRAFVIASVAPLCVLLLARAEIVRRVRPYLTGHVAFGVLAAAVLALTTYGYWWRPQPSNAPQWKYERIGYSFDVSRDYSQDSLVNLAKYLSPFVLWLAIAGWLVVLWRRVRRGRDGFLIPALVVIGCWSLVYLWNPGVYPDHFWGVRRFVPVIIPGFVLCAAIAAAEVTSQLPRTWAVTLAGAALIFVAGFTLHTGQLLFFFAENRGLFSQLRELAERLPADEVIVTHGYKTWVTPLYAAFDRKVVPIDFTTTEGSTLSKQWAARQKSRGKPSYLLVEVDKPSNQASKVDEFVLSRAFVQPTVDPLPTKIVHSQWRLELYKFPP